MNDITDSITTTILELAKEFGQDLDMDFVEALAAEIEREYITEINEYDDE